MGFYEMQKVVAFLRAINVGGHTVKMADLRTLFDSMGCRNVETFIASGNVIFDSEEENNHRLEAKIEQTLIQALGYQVVTFIRTTTEVAQIAAYKPFPREEIDRAGHNLYIAFLPDKPGENARRKLETFTTEIDEFHINGREVYWLCRKNMSESEFSGALLEKTLGMPATLRNSKTIIKIAAKYNER